jgi:hypothetical protein
MKRGIAVVIVGLVSLTGGCASQARVVNYNDVDGSGVVAVPSSMFLYRRAAISLIESKVGPNNYRIIDEREVPVGQSTQNTQQTNTDQVQNRRNPNLVGERQTTTATSTTQNITEYQIKFVRLPAQQPFINDINNRGVTPGLTPAGGVGAGPAPGVVPSVTPGGGPGAGQPIGIGAPRAPGGFN